MSRRAIRGWEILEEQLQMCRADLRYISWGKEGRFRRSYIQLRGTCRLQPIGVVETSPAVVQVKFLESWASNCLGLERWAGQGRAGSRVADCDSLANYGVRVQG